MGRLDFFLCHFIESGSHFKVSLVHRCLGCTKPVRGILRKWSAGSFEGWWAWIIHLHQGQVLAIFAKLAEFRKVRKCKLPQGSDMYNICWDFDSNRQTHNEALPGSFLGIFSGKIQHNENDLEVLHSFFLYRELLSIKKSTTLWKKDNTYVLSLGVFS